MPSEAYGGGFLLKCGKRETLSLQSVKIRLEETDFTAGNRL
ncbi:hypothetical protein NEICINOT_03487 [Neisseria cinerea ATCC 14685]|uniref:Uncharacterized protein n=1 Tax=Neisseria cinerea ATCC 14685 TaxID=546262 RepID=D0W1G6_NEICI|nr:hypothetical protein NEICINOT_03487 [Neisseria cinerea ATCC 14685]